MLAETESIIAKLLVNKPSARARVRRLSGGQRQSIAIARAISWGSSFVIMDEPTAALGVRETKAVEELMLRLRSEGIAQLVVSHDLEQVMRISDRIVVLRRGQTVADFETRLTTHIEVVAAITGFGSDTAS